MARERELTVDQEKVVRELFAKGQSREELAVGFGVSYNTIRNILANSEPAQAPAGDAA